MACTCTQAELGAIIAPRTVAEIAAGVTPSVFAGDGGIYLEGNPRRYGAVGNGTTTGGGANDTAPVLDAIKVIKAAYNESNDSGPFWDLHRGDNYRVTSVLHFGRTPASAGRIKHFRSNGARFIIDHTGVGVDLTGTHRNAFKQLEVTSRTDGINIPKIQVAVTRYGNSSAIFGSREFDGLKISGQATIAGYFNFCDESSTYKHCHVIMDSLSGNSPLAGVLTDTGRYWNGSAFVDAKSLLAFMDPSDPVLPGQTMTNNHYVGCNFNNKSTQASGGVAGLQMIGASRQTFHGLFLNVNDPPVRPVQTLRDSAVGGNGIYGLRVFGFNPHGANQVAWENVMGNMEQLELYGDHPSGATVADLLMTAGDLVDSTVQLQKVVLNGKATGDCVFRIADSIEVKGDCEGRVYLNNGASVIYTGGTNATKRFVIHESDSRRTYGARDVRDFSAVSTSGTGEDNLKTYGITGSSGFMGAAGRRMRVWAAGTKTGSAGNKIIKFHLGATSWTVFPSANDVLPWKFEAEIYTTASNAQVLLLRFSQNNVVVYDQRQTAALDMLMTQTMKLTGECLNAADQITQNLWVVEYD